MLSGRVASDKRLSGSSVIIMIISLFILFLSVSFLPQSVFAGTAIIRLAWNPNTESDLAGYRVYFGTSPRTGTDPKVCGLCGYSAVVDAGNATTFRIPGLVQRQTYYISMTAYDTSGNESAFSGQVSGPAKEVYTNFDGDGKTDIAVYRLSTGVWYIIPSSGGAPYGVGWGLSTDVPVPGDYDGDGKTDIAVYRKSDGRWYIIPSSGSAPYTIAWGGDATDIPVPGDYDKDGKTDLAVYRSNTGAWNIRPSSGAAPYVVGWGGDATDEPVPGDYDGDGKTDIAVYQAGIGTWYIRPSSGAASYAAGWGGDATDEPVPGDYDRDGKTDIAVYQAGIGVWYIRPSSGAAPYAVGWGGDATDKPVPGDYDGDGKTDIAVYRSGTGAWYVIPSSGAAAFGVGWGGNSSDIPVTTNISSIGTQASAGDYTGNLIDDNFDDGNLAGWATTGTPAVSTDRAHNGTYSVKFNAWENINRTVAGSSELYLAAWLYTGDARPSTSNEIFQIWAGATSAGKLYIESDGTLAFWNDIGDAPGGTYVWAGFTAIADSTWTHIELRIKKGNPNGEIQIWINEQMQVNDTTQNLGTSNWDKVTFGSLNRSPDSAIYLDEIKVDNAGRIGSSP